MGEQMHPAAAGKDPDKGAARRGLPAKSPATATYRHDNPLSYNPPQYKPDRAGYCPTPLSP